MTRIALAAALTLCLLTSLGALWAEHDDWMGQAPVAHGVLGPPLGLTLAPGLGGGWNGQRISVQSHFYATWHGSKPIRARCGLPTGPENRVRGGYQQRFQRCRMTEAQVRVVRDRATPAASPTKTVAIVSPPPPTPQPSPTSVPPTVAPTPNTPALFELSLMNASRAQYGLPPYSENRAMSSGSGSCIGSLGHSEHMAAIHTMAHDQFPADVCSQSYPLGENIGYASGGVDQALQVIHSLMMSEPHSPGCQGNHACSILSTEFHQVGIGVFTDASGTTWMTVDFSG